MGQGQRFIGITAAVLVASASALAAPTSTASAAPRPHASASHSVTRTAASYRLVRGAQMRRLGAGTSATTLAQVTKAVHASEFTSGVPSSDYTVRGLLTSGSWARVTLQPKKTAELDPATVLLRKRNGAWTVVDLGTAGVGCDVAPEATLASLRLSCD